MLDYAKTVLPQVTNWKKLFRKELIKCVNWAGEDEWSELYIWCYESFYDIYPDVLNEVFNFNRIGKKVSKITDAPLKRALVAGRPENKTYAEKQKNMLMN